MVNLIGSMVQLFNVINLEGVCLIIQQNQAIKIYHKD
jgi:hypothetical protein